MNKKSLLYMISVFSIFIIMFFVSSCTKDEPITPSSKSIAKKGYKPAVIFIDSVFSSNTFLKGSNGTVFLNGGNGNSFLNGGNGGNNFPSGGATGTTFPGQ